MLVVVRVDAETGDKAVDHEVHIRVLAARPSWEGLGWVEEQCLMGRHIRCTIKNGCEFNRTELWVQPQEINPCRLHQSNTHDKYGYPSIINIGFNPDSSYCTVQFVLMAASPFRGKWILQNKSSWQSCSSMLRNNKVNVSGPNSWS